MGDLFLSQTIIYHFVHFTQNTTKKKKNQLTNCYNPLWKNKYDKIKPEKKIIKTIYAHGVTTQNKSMPKK